MLAYIIAALIWWFIALNQQNRMLSTAKMHRATTGLSIPPPEVAAVNKERDRKTSQYLGEGITFLSLILIGAVVVFRALRKQFRQSQQQRHFVMAITHELKTPIAVTKLNLETLQKHKLNEDQEKKIISNTIQETNRLNDLCNNMLLASQIESNGYQLMNEQIDFSALISGCVRDFITRFPNRIIKDHIEPSINLNGDMLLLQMAVNNLLDNAIKYSPKDSSVSVSLNQRGQSIRLVVNDEGKGVREDEREKIFLKYYRSGNAHTSEAKGTGLGLFLTKKIIQEHQGKISVSKNNPQGSSFTILLRS